MKHCWMEFILICSLRSQLSAAAHSAIQFQFHSSLPNGKNGLKWMLTGTAAQGNEWAWFDLGCLISLVGYGRLPRQGAPPKRENNNTKSKRAVSFLRREGSSIVFFFFSSFNQLEKLIERRKREKKTIGEEWAAAIKEINQSINQISFDWIDLIWFIWVALPPGPAIHQQMNSISFQFLQLCEEMKEMNEFVVGWPPFRQSNHLISSISFQQSTNFINY